MAIYQKVNIKADFEKLPLKKTVLFALFLSVITFLIGLLSQIFLPPEIPLFYGMPYGESQVAKSIFILTPPAISLVFIFINIILTLKLESQFIKKTLITASLFISILSFIAVFRIISLVGQL